MEQDTQVLVVLALGWTKVLEGEPEPVPLATADAG